MKQEQDIFEQAIALPSREAQDGYLLGARDRDLATSVAMEALQRFTFLKWTLHHADS